MATNPPCLYAIELRSDNPRGAKFYVGRSDAHTAECKFSIHTRGICICGTTSTPNPYTRRPLPRVYGVRLFDAVDLPGDISTDDRQFSEDYWAQELADEHNVITWCDGRAYSPQKPSHKR